jgi:hypothetical protein
MQINVYRGPALAASFDYDGEPGLATFYGAPGMRVCALVEAPHWVTNPWTGERRFAPPTELPDWWAARILSAGLERDGLRLSADGLPRFGAAQSMGGA